MTIDETLEELEKLRAWRGGDGATPVYADGFQIIHGKIDQGRAVLVTNSVEAQETAEKIEEGAQERALTMLSNAEDEAGDAFGDALDAIEDVEKESDLSLELRAILKELHQKLNRIDTYV